MLEFSFLLDCLDAAVQGENNSGKQVPLPLVGLGGFCDKILASLLSFLIFL